VNHGRLAYTNVMHGHYFHAVFARITFSRFIIY